MRYIIKIVDDETGEIVRSFERESKRDADKVADGASINLNHERFSVRVEATP